MEAHRLVAHANWAWSYIKLAASFAAKVPSHPNEIQLAGQLSVAGNVADVKTMQPPYNKPLAGAGCGSELAKTPTMGP